MIEDTEVAAISIHKDFGKQPAKSRLQWRHLMDATRSDIVYATVPIYARQLSAEGLARIRGLRLKVACMGHQVETGKAVERLDELVPRYFVALPKTPWGSGDFEYTTDADKILKLFSETEREEYLGPVEAAIYDPSGDQWKGIVPNLLKKQPRPREVP